MFVSDTPMTNWSGSSLFLNWAAEKRTLLDDEGGAHPELSPLAICFALHYSEARVGASCPQPRVLSCFDAALGRWRISLSEGHSIKKGALPLKPPGRHFAPFALTIAEPPQQGSGSYLPGGRPPVNVLRKGGRSPNSERSPQRTPQWRCEARRGGCQACRGPSDCLCQLTRHARMSAPGTTRKSQCRTNVAEWRTSSSFRCSLPQSRRNCEGPGSTWIPCIRGSPLNHHNKHRFSE